MKNAFIDYWKELKLFKLLDDRISSFFQVNEFMCEIFVSNDLFAFFDNA